MGSVARWGVTLAGETWTVGIEVDARDHPGVTRGFLGVGKVVAKLFGLGRRRGSAVIGTAQGGSVGGAAPTIHFYRARWDEVDPDPRSAALDAKLKATKRIATPTIYVGGTRDGVNPPEAAKDAPGKFPGPLEALLLEGVGHFPAREAPDIVTAALVGHFSDVETGQI